MFHCHKSKKELKFQAITTSNGIFLHSYGPMEEIIDEWKFCILYGVEEKLKNTMESIS